MDDYVPNPLNVDDIELAEGLDELIEALAENVHEEWAAGRVRDGWRYGSERNDREKLHPCLVPYDKLPENEKEYDRNTAIATLKFICKSGYRIIK